MNSIPAPSEAPARASDARYRPLAPAALAALGAAVGLGLSWSDDVSDAVQPGGAHLAADVPSDDLLDTDGDGLADAYEWVLRSDPDLTDSDADGFGDLEEFARGSLPYFAGSTPEPGELSSSMTARRGESMVHLLFATWAADGDDVELVPSLGMLMNDSLVGIPAGYVELYGSMEVFGAPDGSVIQLVHLPVRLSIFELLGGLSLFGTAARGDTGLVATADAVDVRFVDEELFLRMTTRARPMSRGDLSTPSGSSSGGSVYVPLPAPGQIPSTWTAGQICRQTSVVVGVSDGVVTREVVGAECVEAFDSYCKSDCTLSVGSTEKSVDPLSLIGG